MTESVVAALAACWLCERPFWFDPDMVPSIPVDPDTGMPPLPDDPRAMERAWKQPLCTECIAAANRIRASRGLPRWAVQ